MIEILDGITAIGRMRQWKTIRNNLKGQRLAQDLSPRQAYVRITKMKAIKANEGYRLELFRRAAVYAASDESLRHKLMDRLMDFSENGSIAKPQFDQIHLTINRTVMAERKKGNEEASNSNQLGRKAGA